MSIRYVVLGLVVAAGFQVTGCFDRTSVTTDPSPRDSASAERLFNEARVHHSRGEFREAREKFETLVRDQPSAPLSSGHLEELDAGGPVLPNPTYGEWAKLEMRFTECAIESAERRTYSERQNLVNRIVAALNANDLRKIESDLLWCEVLLAPCFSHGTSVPPPQAMKAIPRRSKGAAVSPVGVSGAGIHLSGLESPLVIGLAHTRQGWRWTALSPDCKVPPDSPYP